MSDDGGPAFPQTETTYEPRWDGASEMYANVRSYGGMTLRDWFAGQALYGLFSCISQAPNEVIARQAYAMADAMIAERKSRNE